MPSVTRQQLSAFSRDRKQQLRQRLLAHLKTQHADWCAGRNDAALLRHVDASIAHSLAHGVQAEANLLRMASLQLLPGFSTRPGGWPHFRLTQACFDEHTRVRHFEQALRDPSPPRLVRLDTDLAALERAHG